METNDINPILDLNSHTSDGACESNTETQTNDITKPSIIRLARRAGVKSVSDECLPFIRQIINKRLTELIITALIVNSEHQTKTLMAEDIYDGCSLIGQNITQSNDFGTGACNK